ncbi:ATP-binding cassette domain-containing protein [Amylolactobacillus amylophilus]|uniref:ATP-binding cassette domain-containing protein n=1 Tax=Amylolactobacillus amylophilus TaxID=1603 RepID=UPI0006D082B8|nr:ATP-binding cassette domain-containing protein [Amylolactobacillus amylophilus]
MNKLVVEQLSKSFDEQNVLENTSFTFEQGKIYGMLGRNGAGKTTFFLIVLLKMNNTKADLSNLSKMVIRET